MSKNKEKTAKTRMLGRAIALALEHADCPQSRLAREIGMTAGHLSHIVAGARRAEPPTLRLLWQAPIWTHAGDQARIMIGHLRDELARAGWGRRRDIAIYPRPRPASAPGAVRAALKILLDQAGCEDVAALIVDLADIVQRGQCAGAQDGVCDGACRIHYPPAVEEKKNISLAAESGSTYKTEKAEKPKKNRENSTAKPEEK